MIYTDPMETSKRKYFLYLPYADAAKLEDVLQRALERDPRTNASEVIRELIGFPKKHGFNFVTTKEDRDYLSGKIDSIGKPEKLTRARSGRKITVGSE